MPSHLQQRGRGSHAGIPHDAPDSACNRPAYHKMHLCVLKHMGQMQILDELSARPAFRCCRCGAEAASDKNLCQPRPL